MRKTVILLGLITSLLGMGKLWHLAKDGFQLSRALFPPLQKEMWPREPLSLAEEKTISSLLAQPYVYLGRGHQCYAFASRDGRYVLKLLRHDRYHPTLLRRSLTIPFCTPRNEIHTDLSHRFVSLMNSFQIAWQDLPKETALLYLHIGAQPNTSLPPLSLIDPLGRHYTLDSRHVDFILQEKKELLLPRLQQALHSANKNEAQRLIDLWVQFVVFRAEKGICNKDPSFVRNFGIDAEKIVQIDIGSFYRRKEPMTREARLASIHQTLDPVREWLQPIDAELAAYLEEKLSALQSRPS